MKKRRRKEKQAYVKNEKIVSYIYSEDKRPRKWRFAEDIGRWMYAAKEEKRVSLVYGWTIMYVEWINHE